jgi:predicted DNA binding protein
MVNHPNRYQKAAERRFAAALDPAQRQLADKLEVLLAAAINKDNRINKWEMEFLSGILQRFARYGEQIKLTEKQIEIVEKIHEKVKDVFAI